MILVTEPVIFNLPAPLCELAQPSPAVMLLEFIPRDGIEFQEH